MLKAASISLCTTHQSRWGSAGGPFAALTWGLLCSRRCLTGGFTHRCDTSAGGLGLLRAGCPLLSTCVSTWWLKTGQKSRSRLKHPHNITFTTFCWSKQITRFIQRRNSFHLWMGEQHVQGWEEFWVLSQLFTHMHITLVYTYAHKYIHNTGSRKWRLTIKDPSCGSTFCFLVYFPSFIPKSTLFSYSYSSDQSCSQAFPLG